MRTQIHTGEYLHMGKFTPGSDQMQILFLQIHTCKSFVPCERKVKCTHEYLYFSQYSAFKITNFHIFLFITDYMTVAETVNIVAK